MLKSWMRNGSPFLLKGYTPSLILDSQSISQFCKKCVLEREKGRKIRPGVVLENRDLCESLKDNIPKRKKSLCKGFRKWSHKAGILARVCYHRLYVENLDRQDPSGAAGFLGSSYKVD